MSALATGLAADLVVGDPRRLHPVAGFGAAAEAFEGLVYAPSRGRGAVHAGLLIGSVTLGVGLTDRKLRQWPWLRWAFRTGVAWTVIGARSLVREASAVAGLLDENDLESARRRLPSLVGRDPAELDAAQMSRAVVESVAENTGDAVVAALFWGAVAGPAGMAGYRAANTLDAMVGHPSPRYERFGWAAARADDALNLIPARVGAALTAACAPLVGGNAPRTWSTACRDGRSHPSPNAGWMEAAFAGALDVCLGGPLTYAGRAEHRPVLGTGRPTEPGDIRRATRLSLAVGILAAAVAGGMSSLVAGRIGRRR